MELQFIKDFYLNNLDPEKLFEMLYIIYKRSPPRKLISKILHDVFDDIIMFSTSKNMENEPSEPPFSSNSESVLESADEPELIDEESSPPKSKKPNIVKSYIKSWENDKILKSWIRKSKYSKSEHNLLFAQFVKFY